MNVERQMAVEEAYAIAQRAILNFNLRSEIEAYGIEIQTFRCKLIDDTNKKIFYGFGKGLGLQSKVSAMYEALEHYTVHSFGQNIANDHENYYKIADFLQPLPCVYLSEVQTNRRLLFPVYKLDPRYSKCKSLHDKNDYTAHSWRAIDSGIASGTNLTEAKIHALNEIVERDAHSLFLIEAFLKKQNKSVRLIDKDSVPSYLQAIIKTIEQQYQEDLMVFDITSDIGIPVIYVSMTRQPYLIQPSGCGASLSREYALERALLESLQPRHVFNDNLFDNQKTIVQRFSKSPLLQKAAIADVKTLNDLTRMDFAALPHYTSFSTLEIQLDAIIGKIKAQGFDIFTVPLIDEQAGFSCVKCLVPGMEDFHMVQTGKCILPNDRGMMLLRSKFEKERCAIKSQSGSLYGGCQA